MSNFKEKAKKKYETAKEYVKEHKEEIALCIWGGIVCAIGGNIGYNRGHKDGFYMGCTLQNEYDKAVIDNALEMNKYINNYDNEEDK